MKSIRPWGFFFALLIFMVAPGPARVQAAEPATPEKTGLAIGQQAPDFKLKDQNGQEHSLAEMLKKGKVALVFHRSADW